MLILWHEKISKFHSGFSEGISRISLWKVGAGCTGENMTTTDRKTELSRYKVPVTRGGTNSASAPGPRLFPVRHSSPLFTERESSHWGTFAWISNSEFQKPGYH